MPTDSYRRVAILIERLTNIVNGSSGMAVATNVWALHIRMFPKSRLTF